MAISYTWKFEQFDTAPAADGLADVVKIIHWRLIGTEDQYVASIYGSASLPAPDPDNFLAYEDITKSWAESAVISVVDLPALEASLEADIARQKNPPIVSAPPPFTN